MRKILLSIVATIILILSGVLCACTSSDITIENTNWQLQVAIRADIENQQSEVIARNNEWIVEDTSTPNLRHHCFLCLSYAGKKKQVGICIEDTS